EMDKVLNSHQYILGPAVKEFEEQMQEYLQVKHAVGCANGTDALVLALKALEIGNGDEVITTPFTFFATASCIHRVGAKPVFVDVKEDTFNIDPDQIEKAISNNTKAIIPVHLFGQAAEMDKIMEIAKKHHLYVIEDNAQGIGCQYDGKYAGTIADIGTLSFFPSKNLGCMGDGGMCLTQNDDLAAKLKQLRVHGESPKYFHKWVGLNSRLDSLQAAVLKVKLRYLQGWSDARRKNAQLYYELLKDVKEIKLPYIHPKADSIYNQFTIVSENRDELMKELQAQEIGCAIYYPLPLHVQECFAEVGQKEGDCPIAERLAKQVVSIPIYSELTEEQIRFVAETIINFYK
nr:DegT/DnrJ/EryC1/StrS family aminotransferase [Candidatus Cloacimonadota bacterium]